MLRDIYYDLPNADRHYFLLQLEFDENDQKWELFLDILKTPDKNDSYYDILAIEVLKILKLSDIPPSYIEQLLAIYIGILKSGSDDDIRNYTIMSSVNFININKELKDTIIEILFNEDEFIVLRENSYFSILELNSKTEKMELLSKLVSDKELSEYAKNDILGIS